MKEFVGNMSKKVLIHTRNLVIPGGKQSYIIALEPYFKSDISYFFYGSLENIKESRLTFLKRFFGDYFRFYRRLKKERFDVVHINTSFNLKSYFRDSIFTWICWWTNTPSVVYWHGWRWDFEERIARKIKWYFRLTFAKADTMVVLAREFQQQLTDYYGYKKPVVLETTVVEDEVMALANEQENIPTYRNGNGHPVILFLSRVEKAKGIYETIDSFKRLLSKFPNLVLDIGGTGGELDKVKQYVADKQIPNINFLGWLAGQTKINAIQKADIFVLASYSEGMPISVLEAMSAGLSVVTTDVGGVKDFFEDGKMGSVVQVKDVVSLEEKFDQLLSNPAMRKKIGQYNMAYAKKRFAAAEVASRLEDIYTSIIKKV